MTEYVLVTIDFNYNIMYKIYYRYKLNYGYERI